MCQQVSRWARNGTQGVMLAVVVCPSIARARTQCGVWCRRTRRCRQHCTNEGLKRARERASSPALCIDVYVFVCTNANVKSLLYVWRESRRCVRQWRPVALAPLALLLQRANDAKACAQGRASERAALEQAWHRRGYRTDSVYRQTGTHTHTHSTFACLYRHCQQHSSSAGASSENILTRIVRRPLMN